MEKPVIYSRQTLYEATAGAQIQDFFNDVLRELNNNSHDEGAALFNGTMIKIRSTDNMEQIIHRWNKERKTGGQ